jgi:hypothetical protein
MNNDPEILSRQKHITVDATAGTAVLKRDLPRYAMVRTALTDYLALPDKKRETALKAAMKAYALTYYITGVPLRRLEEIDE